MNKENVWHIPFIGPRTLFWNNFKRVEHLRKSPTSFAFISLVEFVSYWSDFFYFRLSFSTIFPHNFLTSCSILAQSTSVTRSQNLHFAFPIAFITTFVFLYSQSIFELSCHLNCFSLGFLQVSHLFQRLLNLFCWGHFFTLLAQTFGYLEMDFECHILYTYSPLESAHGQCQLQFCTRRENTFAVTVCTRSI